jgi:uncharacterized protein
MSNRYVFKAVIAGAGGVGKTALLQRYVSGTFEEDHKMTIGAAFSIKELNRENGDYIRTQYWDFAGEERFRFMLPNYCIGASGGIICYDVTDYATFENIPEWLRIIRNKAPQIPVFLVGNKYDLKPHEVDLETAEQYASDSGCICNVMCSSKLNLNIEDLFNTFTDWLIHYENEND